PALRVVGENRERGKACIHSGPGGDRRGHLPPGVRPPVVPPQLIARGGEGQCRGQNTPLRSTPPQASCPVLTRRQVEEARLFLAECKSKPPLVGTETEFLRSSFRGVERDAHRARPGAFKRPDRAAPQPVRPPQVRAPG